MIVRPTALPDIIELTPVRHGDDRGYFSEVFHRGRLAQAGITNDWLQDNQSLSAAMGTVRGLHFQIAPHAQAKLVRVLNGAIFDVAVDVRADSATYGQWVGVELSAAAHNQLFIPAGFAHGFATLQPDTIVLYKVDAPYAPDCERAIRWDDADIGIKWPINGAPHLSEKDARAPALASVAPVVAPPQTNTQPTTTGGTA
ncbi:MAG: dTDP-4-dehydrorhamnose 3,5-epimerase [Sphingopyxis sp.]